MTEDSPNRPEQTESSPPTRQTPPATSRAISLPKLILLILNAWGDLFRSRQNLLLRFYAGSIRTLNPDAPAPTTLEEARRQLSMTAKGPALPDSARNLQESMDVLMTRMVAAWLFFWTAILPAATVAWCWFNRLREIPDPDGPDKPSLALYLSLNVAVFVFTGFVGLVIQGFLARPFSAILSKVTNIPIILPQTRKPSDPGDSTAKKNTRESAILRFGAWLGVCVMLMGAPIGVCATGKLYLEARASTAWPMAAGTITSAEMVKTTGGYYRVDLAYDYRVGGRDFTGTGFYMSDRSYGSRYNALEAIREITTEKPCQVFYNPANPQQAVLRPGARFQDVLPLLINIGMLVFSVWLMQKLWHTRRKR